VEVDKYFLSRTPVITGRTREHLVGYEVKSGDPLPGCSVISTRGRCGQSGKLRVIACLHEHMSIPTEICDDCVRLIEVRDCLKCYESKQPHTGCKMFVIDAPSPEA